MNGGNERSASYVRHGLGLLCIAAIGIVVGLAGRNSADDQAFGEGPSVGETIAQIVGAASVLLGLVAFAYIAYGLLRD